MRPASFVALALAACALTLSGCERRAERLVEVAFTIPLPDMIPEGIAYDSVERAFYVGSTYHRSVWRVNVNGGSEPAEFIAPGTHRLWGIVGMKIDQRRRLLWLASSHAGDGMPMADMDPALEGSTGLFAFDLDSGELRHRTVLAQPGFLNDVTLATDGTVYVTDSRGRHVYRYSEGPEVEPFVDLGEHGSPNGLDLGPDGSFLFVAAGPRIVRVDIASRDVLEIARDSVTAGLIDGLYVTGGSLVAVQPYAEGRYVVRIDLDGAMSAIVGEQVLVTTHPALEQPSTGAIVGRDFYVIANSHLQTFRQMWSEGAVAESATLSVPTILRVPLVGP